MDKLTNTLFSQMLNNSQNINKNASHIYKFERVRLGKKQ